MFNMQLAKAFIKHRAIAKTRHGVHSPFVFRLIDKVIYDFKPRPVFSSIENLRKDLIKDERTLTITDLGAGSRINNNKQKKVKQLASHALKPPKIAQLIYRIVNDLKPENIVELGTCLGLTTAYLSAGAPDAEIVTIEGCPETATIAKQNLERLNVNNVQLSVGNFDEQLPMTLKELGVLDFIFIDGNHRKEATLQYFKDCLPYVRENSVMIFDDIYWSKGMEEAWGEIKDHSQVSVTIDLFWIGIVFFKKDQAKEHFRIKF
jgi:predicted O-methyltransferase YrrM